MRFPDQLAGSCSNGTVSTLLRGSERTANSGSTSVEMMINRRVPLPRLDGVSRCLLSNDKLLVAMQGICREALKSLAEDYHTII